MTRVHASKLANMLNALRVYPEDTANEIPFSLLQYENPDQELINDLIGEPSTWSLTWNPWEFRWEILRADKPAPMPSTEEMAERRAEQAEAQQAPA